MKISIITPTFNSASYIARNLNSIQAQTFIKIQHIIIDNLSSDETLAIIKSISPKSIVHSQSDKGISDAFNKGIEASNCDIIGILNSDDEYYDENVLKRVSDAFEDPSVDFVHGDMLFIDKEHGTNVRRPLLCPLSYAMPFNHPTMFLRKKIYDEVGLFKLDYRFAMDFELVCRMYQDESHCRYKGYYLSGDPIVKMYAGGISWNQELKSIDDVEKALKYHQMWNDEAAENLSLRRKRIKLKTLLSRLHLNVIIRMWRKFKWA